MVNYKEVRLGEHKRYVCQSNQRWICYPCFQLQQYGTAAGHRQSSCRNKISGYLPVSKGARNYANQTLLRYMAEGAVEYAKELGCAHPEIVLHLDHGDSFELCKVLH